MNTTLDLRLAGGHALIPLPPDWTGKITINVFRGRLSRDGGGVDETRSVCPQCGTPPVTVGLSSRTALGEG